MPSLTPSLSSLRHHSIFIPPTNQANTSTTPEGWEMFDAPEMDGLVPLKTSRFLVREKEVFVAHGRELRAANIGEGGWEVHEGKLGRYKTVRSQHLDFRIQSLVLNPTGRLLAVVGKNQVTVLVLPKSGVMGHTSGDLHCKSFPIDPFQFSATSSSIITKAAWHAWGEGGTSLWILTSDGRLREYDITQPEDPSQEFAFLPPSPTHSSFSAIDPLSRYCTSFAFGPTDTLDFGPTIVHVLCANGDLYFMGPILPLRALVPRRWIEGVGVVAERVGGLKIGWVESLVKQVEEGRRGDEREDERAGALGASVMRGRPAEDENGDDGEDAMVRVHPPHLTRIGGPAPGLHRAIVRQGPVALDPAPEEAGAAEEDEDKATDLVLLQGDEGEIVYGIAWSGGRVDLGMMVDQPMPRWSSTRDTAQEEPTLAIIDSVLLPLSDDPEMVEQNAPVFVRDPLSSDLVYVQHAFGLDAISVRSWLGALGRDEESLPTSDVVRLFDSASEAINPMIGTAVFCNIALGYGVASLASTYQLATVELDFRATSADSHDNDEPARDTAPEHKEPGSLLSTKPLSIDTLLTDLRAKAIDPRQTARAISTATITSVSGTTLRQIAELIAKLQQWTAQIRAASQVLENHLDLCAKEFQRQLRVVKQCRSGYDRIKSPRGEAGRVERVESMVKRQEGLMGRLDRVLAALGGEYRPGVSDVEGKWFEEIEGMRRRVGLGVDESGGVVSAKGEDGLVGRAAKIKEQLEALRPVLEARAEVVASQSPSTAKPGEEEVGSTASPARVTSRQIKPLEYALAQRSEEIKRLMTRMESLSLKMDVAMEVKDDEEGE